MELRCLNHSVMTVVKGLNGIKELDDRNEGKKVTHLVQSHRRATVAQTAENINAGYE